MSKKLPTFLVIGAQKAGTTWLYTQFVKHPEIWIPPKKELHYFDGSSNFSVASPIDRAFKTKGIHRQNMRRNTQKILKYLREGRLLTAKWWIDWTFGYYSDDWYSRLFSQGASYGASGELTPEYSILSEQKIARIKAMNPDIKLIFMIRHPVERAWSGIRFASSRGWLKISLDSENEIIEALKPPSQIYSRGDYGKILDIYLKYFDSEQILIGFYDAISCDPMGLLSDITKFLGVSLFDEDKIDNQTLVNASPKYEIPSKVEDYLLETYEPIINDLAKRLGSYATIWQKRGISNNELLDNKYPIDRLAPTVHP
jgi:hypothetical protein